MEDTLITQSMIEESINGYKPSISANILKEHEEIRKRMESVAAGTNRIGFK